MLCMSLFGWNLMTGWLSASWGEYQLSFLKKQVSHPHCLKMCPRFQLKFHRGLLRPSEVQWAARPFQWWCPSSLSWDLPTINVVCLWHLVNDEGLQYSFLCGHINAVSVALHLFLVSRLLDFFASYFGSLVVLLLWGYNACLILNGCERPWIIL